MRPHELIGTGHDTRSGDDAQPPFRRSIGGLGLRRRDSWTLAVHQIGWAVA